MYDIILKNAKILKGKLESAIVGDIAIEGGKIVKIGNVDSMETANIIDCTDLYVSPGFIDSHSHEDVAFGDEFPELGKISQGVTTVVAGMCGSSMAPTKDETVGLLAKIYSSVADNVEEELRKYTTYCKYIKCLKEKKHRLNYKLLVGHSTIRIAVMGIEQREPTKEELNEMKNMLREAMENGAAGLSTGRIYPPGVFAKNDEIVELLKVVKEYDGHYAVHMRNESDDVIKSVKEEISIAKEAGVRLVISHHKISGRENWGTSKETLRIIEENIKEGKDITLDQYPYNSAMSHLFVVLPPNCLDGGVENMVKKLKDIKFRNKAVEEILNPTYKWENWYKSCGGFEGVLIVEALFTKNANGKTVKEYAEELGKNEFDVFFDLLIENNGAVATIYFYGCDEDIERILKFPHTLIGSDGILVNREKAAHPRGFGTFSRVIKKYVKDKNILSLEEAIYKMTALTAEKWKIKNKGQIKEGYDADLVVFDYKKIEDKASYEDQYALSDGIEVVIVNGKIAYKDKNLTDEYAGKVI